MTSAVISRLYLIWEEFSTLITSFLRFFMNVTVIFQFSFCGKVFRANWTAKCQVFHLCLSTHNWGTNWFLIPRTHNWSTNWFLNEWMNSHFRPWIVLIPRNDLQSRTWSESFFSSQKSSQCNFVPNSFSNHQLKFGRCGININMETKCPKCTFIEHWTFCRWQ